MIYFYHDGTGWCAIQAHFSDEDTSPVGHGDTIQDAADDLGKQTGRWSAAPAKGAHASSKPADEYGKRAAR
jgi:hypothetical protein